MTILDWVDSQKRSQLRVALVADSLEFASSLRKRLNDFALSSYLLPDEEVLLQQVEKDPPHVAVLWLNALSMPVEDFLQRLQELQPEVQVLAVTSEASELKSVFASEPGPLRAVVDGKSVEVVELAIHQLLENQYLVYQNEQLVGDLKREQANRESLQKQVLELEARPQQQVGFYLPEEVKILSSAENKEELVHRFFERLGDLTSSRVCGLLFRYFGAQNALIPLQAWGVEPHSFRGLGVPCAQQNPEQPEALKAFMKDVFRVQSFWSFPFFQLQDYEGLFVIWSDEEISRSMVENLVEVFQLVYDRKWAHRIRDQQNLLDPLTQFHAYRLFAKDLAVEAERHKRLQQSLALLWCRVDHLDLAATQASQAQDLIKKIAELARQTSRAYDRLYSVSSEEFLILLPHTSLVGAQERAERLAKAVEKISATQWAVPLTLSIGCSAYPQHTPQVVELKDRAQKALRNCVREGGNRIASEPAESESPPFITSPS